MLSRVERINDDINALFASEREELWAMQGVVPNTVDLMAMAIERYENSKRAKRLLRVPEVAEYLGVSDYIVRTWLTSGVLKNENLAGGQSLISVKQLEDLKEKEPNKILRKMKRNKKSDTSQRRLN